MKFFKGKNGFLIFHKPIKEQSDFLARFNEGDFSVACNKEDATLIFDKIYKRKE